MNLNLFHFLKNFTALCCFFSLPTMIHAQAISLQWAKSFGGNHDNEYVNQMVMDDANNIYVTGYFMDTTDFDPSTNTHNLVSSVKASNVSVNSTYIAKYSSSGSLVWVKALNQGSGTNYANSISIDKGDLVISGYCADTVVFGSGAGGTLIATSTLNGFVAKYDTSGNFVWVRKVGGADPLQPTYLTSSTISADGSIFATGSYTDLITFSGTSITLPATTTSYQQAYLLKFKADGTLQWARNFGTTGEYQFAYAEGMTVAADDLNNVYVAGRYRYKIDLDPGMPDSTIVYNEGQNTFFSKFDANGNFIWGKSVQGGTSSSVTIPSRLVVDKHQKSFYLTGTIQGNIDFDPGIGTGQIITSTSDVFFAKYDTAGNYIWAKHLTGDRRKTIRDIKVSKNSEHIYLTGLFIMKTDFNPGVDTAFMYTDGRTISNIYIAKYDTAGQYDWAVKLNSATGSNDEGFSMSLDGLGGIYTTGTFKGITDFDPGSGTTDIASNTGSKDIFLAKYIDGCPTYSLLNENVCDSFVFNGTTLKQSGTYYDTISRPGTCDSIVVLQLNLTQSTFAPVVKGEYCDSANFNGITYTTTGVYTQTINNVEGCDSVLTFDVVIKGATQESAITERVCEFFTFNDSVYRNSGTYLITLTSESGCDSLVTLDLTIEPGITASVIQNGTTLIANGGDSYQWINCGDNSAIANATGQEFTATENGSYAVVITIGNCSDTSDCIEVKGLSIEGQLGKNNQIYAFPNPAKSKVTISASQSLKNATIKLINVLGQEQEILNNQQGNQFELDLSKYTSGTYIIEVLEGNEKGILRVIKH